MLLTTARCGGAPAPATVTADFRGLGCTPFASPVRWVERQTKTHRSVCESCAEGAVRSNSPRRGPLPNTALHSEPSQLKSIGGARLPGSLSRLWESVQKKDFHPPGRNSGAQDAKQLPPTGSWQSAPCLDGSGFPALPQPGRDGGPWSTSTITTRGSGWGWQWGWGQGTGSETCNWQLQEASYVASLSLSFPLRKRGKEPPLPH